MGKSGTEALCVRRNAKEKARPVCRALSFWYVIERFSSLHCSFVYTKLGNAPLKEVYILIEYTAARTFLGETIGKLCNCKYNRNGYLMRLIYHFCFFMSIL